METEVEERDPAQPGYLDRLGEYADQGLTADLMVIVCGDDPLLGCGYEGDCGDCPNEAIRVETEYTLQTEILKFAKDLVAKWADGSVEK